MAVKSRTPSLASSPHVRAVASGVAVDLVTIAPAATECCRAIEMLAAGDLQYTDPSGLQQTLAGLPAGYRVIEAQAIGAATTAALLVYF